MQMEQLGCIEALEEELQSSRVKMVELEQKLTEQDQVIAQLMGDNLNHLQDNMHLTAHINSSQERMGQSHQAHWKPRRWVLLATIRKTRVGTRATWMLVCLQGRI